MENKELILVVDDAADTVEMIQRKLTMKGFKVLTASNVSDAIVFLENNTVDLVLTDYKMPKISGLELIRHIRDHYKSTKVIMITGYPTIEGAVEAVKVGAEEYLTKPFTDQELFKAVDNVIEKIRLTKLVKNPREKDSWGILGSSRVTERIIETVMKSAQNNTTLFITGEPGTGKEFIARTIHYHSNRSVHNFIHINCSAIPDHLIESECFGQIQEANEQKYLEGLISKANGGTLLFEEITDTPLAFQVKILRLLQDKQIFPFGSKKAMNVNVRVIATSSRDIQKMLKQGLFREDLFYHLNSNPLIIPPLRERKEDIVLLAKHFLENYSRKFALNPPELSEEVVNTLYHYHWYGNIKELDNIIYYLVLHYHGKTVHQTDLPDFLKYTVTHQQSLDKTLEQVEQDYIQQVLRNNRGNKSKTAQILGIDRKTLHNKLQDK